MATHIAKIRWHQQGDFNHQSFERRHEIAFQEGVVLPAGGAGNDFGADPEQLLAASMASCHMQTFLSLAAKKRLQVLSYSDDAEAVLGQRDDGKFWVEKITLNPQVEFGGDKIPDADTIQAMHEKSHQHCFIANSVAAAMVVEIKG